MSDHRQPDPAAGVALHGDPLPRQLRALRRDLPPGNDLWPGIAARIAQVPQGAAAPHAPAVAARLGAAAVRGHGSRAAPWALAASLVLAVGVAWQQRPAIAPPADTPATRILPMAADAMTREYDAALRELQATAGARPADPALRELDRSAAQIRNALAHDPQSRFLFQRLRNTYEKRLQLTQRAAIG